MPCSRVVDLAAHENGTGNVAEGARFVMRVRVIFVVSGRRHFLFLFLFLFLFYCFIFSGVFLMRCSLVGWYIDDDDDDNVSSLTGLGWL